MNRSKLVVFALLLSLNANSQWYYKYGVNDPNLLSDQQLNEALKDSKGLTVGGVAVSFFSVFGIWGGLAIMKAAYEEPEWDVGVGHWIGGFFLTTISIGMETTGIIFIVIGASRSSEIKRILKQNDVKIGFTAIPCYCKSSKSLSPVVPGLTLSFCF